MRKYFKNGNVEKRAGSTIDYWVSIFSSEVFFSQQISESWTKMIPWTTVLSSTLWVESVNRTTCDGTYFSFMLPVIHAGSFFAYLAYEGTQFGAEKMVLFSQRESIFQAKECQWPAEMSPLSSEYHRVAFSRFGGLSKLNVNHRFIWIPTILVLGDTTGCCNTQKFIFDFFSFLKAKYNRTEHQWILYNKNSF